MSTSGVNFLSPAWVLFEGALVALLLDGPYGGEKSNVFRNSRVSFPLLRGFLGKLSTTRVL